MRQICWQTGSVSRYGARRIFALQEGQLWRRPRAAGPDACGNGPLAHVHARIVSIDTRAASAASGVLAGADWRRLPCRRPATDPPQCRSHGAAGRDKRGAYAESQYQMKSILLMRANNPPNNVAAKVSMLTSVAMGFVSAIWASPLWSWPAAFQRMSSRFAA